MTREDAKNILRNAAWLGTDDERNKTEEAVEMAISALEQKPNRHKGHWVKGEEWCETVGGFERWGNDYTCSECGLPLGRYTLTDFCPNCGAEMESEE